MFDSTGVNQMGQKICNIEGANAQSAGRSPANCDLSSPDTSKLAASLIINFVAMSIFHPSWLDREACLTALITSVADATQSAVSRRGEVRKGHMFALQSHHSANILALTSIYLTTLLSCLSRCYKCENHHNKIICNYSALTPAAA